MNIISTDLEAARVNEDIPAKLPPLLEIFKQLKKLSGFKRS
jgi:hypothetical protein